MPDLPELLKELNANPAAALKTLRQLVNVLKVIPLGLLSLVPSIPPKIKALLKTNGPAAVGLLDANVTYLEAHPELLPALVAAFTPDPPAAARKR